MTTKQIARTAMDHTAANVNRDMLEMEWFVKVCLKVHLIHTKTTLWYQGFPGKGFYL